MLFRSEELATNILNVLNDLIGRKVPPTLAADAGRIRAVLLHLAQRSPPLTAEAQQISILLAATQ